MKIDSEEVIFVLKKKDVFGLKGKIFGKWISKKDLWEVDEKVSNGIYGENDEDDVIEIIGCRRLSWVVWNEVIVK